MKHIKKMPLFPISLGIIILLLGIFLNAEVIRILWIIFGALITLLGISAIFMIRSMLRNLKEGEHLPMCPCGEIFEKEKASCCPPDDKDESL